MLTAQPITIRHQQVAGKDTTRLRERRAEWIDAGDERQTYTEPADDLHTLRLTIESMTEADLRNFGIHPQTIWKIRHRGWAGIAPNTLTHLRRAADAFARRR